MSKKQCGRGLSWEIEDISKPGMIDNLTVRALMEQVFDAGFTFEEVELYFTAPLPAVVDGKIVASAELIWRAYK